MVYAMSETLVRVSLTNVRTITDAFKHHALTVSTRDRGDSFTVATLRRFCGKETT
jgi:hypothetical protein